MKIPVISANCININKNIFNNRKNNNFPSFTSLSYSDCFVRNTDNVNFSGVFGLDEKEKRLTEIYDSVYEDMARNAKEALGIDFQKPKLVFKNLHPKINGYYENSQNEIIINRRALKSGCHIRNTNLDKCFTSDLSDGREFREAMVYADKSHKLPESYEFVDDEELLFQFGGVIRHELTHARQDQIMLSSENALEKLYSKICADIEAKDKAKFSKISKFLFIQVVHDFSYDAFLKRYPFYASYKPSKIFKSNSVFASQIQSVTMPDGKFLEIEYTPEDIMDGFISYNSDDLTKYVNSFLEVEARFEELEFYMNYKEFAPNLNIPSEIQEYYKDVELSNCIMLAKDKHHS